MSARSRRQFLCWLTACSPFALAGCLGRTESKTDTRIDQLQVVNYEREPYTLLLEISASDSIVYEDSIDVPSAEDPSSELGDDRWSGANFEEYPTDPGPYVVRAWGGDQSRDDGITLDLREHDHECARIRVHIGEASEESGPRLVFWRTFDCSTND